MFYLLERNYFCAQKKITMKNYNYKIEISASKEEVFKALTNPFQIALWTGYPAVMDTEVGTEFSLWEGDITGKNLEMIENFKIIQEWYFGEQENASIVNLILTRNNGKTVIDLEHTNIPDDSFDEITEGWREYYLGSLQDFLEFY